MTRAGVDAVRRKQLLDTILDRVQRGVQLRRRLPPNGRIHIDRQLPFLVLYRPLVQGAEPSLRRLVSSEASYLLAPSDPAMATFVQDLVRRVAEIEAEVFGGFLLIEFWESTAESNDHETGQPAFDVVVNKDLAATPSVTELVRRLEHVEILGRRAVVRMRPGGRLAPTGLSRVVTAAASRESNIHLVGIGLGPAWKDPESGETFPLVRRALVRQVSRSIQQAAFAFATEETTSRPLHYHALGRRAVVRAVREVDGQLASVAESFDLLLTVTPMNAERAFRQFRRAGNGQEPQFEYRPATADPALLKRRLFDIKIERVEDPTLEMLFREKRSELELKLSLISDRLTPRFLPISIALYGAVEEELVGLAHQLLAEVLDAQGDGGRRVGAAAFAAAAEEQLKYYRSMDSSISPRVEIRDDISALTVSSGNLLVGRSMRIPATRVDALLQHEIGTHVVTYWNGLAQPFRLLGSGLAHHDELQEGLAVLAEYLVAGLTPVRMRTLAARVLAAHAIAAGAEFLDVYRLLRNEYGFGERTSFFVAMRVHRGGGFVKDAAYLRGLRAVVDYVGEGGRLETLLVGKIAPEHTGVVEELQRREILLPPPLRPRFLDHPDSHYRLERIRSGTDLAELVDPA
ncbi:MAG: DUF1704 domain-containing protein [Acidimicrobiia bacterium]|nr:DUF1704 domain-containing protein [Acidimicrobiia bacterium]